MLRFFQEVNILFLKLTNQCIQYLLLCLFVLLTYVNDFFFVTAYEKKFAQMQLDNFNTEKRKELSISLHFQLKQHYQVLQPSGFTITLLNHTCFSNKIFTFILIFVCSEDMYSCSRVKVICIKTSHICIVGMS